MTRLKKNVSIDTRRCKGIISIGGTLGKRKPFDPRQTKALPTQRLMSVYFDKGCACTRVHGVVGNQKNLITRLNAASIRDVVH